MAGDERELDPLNPRGETHDTASDFTAVWVAHTMVEAQLAQAALTEAGIRYLTENFQQNPYDGVLATQSGWARILVRPEDAARAKEVVEQALEPIPLDDEEPDAIVD